MNPVYHPRPDKFLYEKGDFLVGMGVVKDRAEKLYGIPVGIKTNRHAITIAGSGSGKGVAVICNNLLLWPHSALVVDPKGEAAEITAQKRAYMGQKVYVLDPFNSARVPDEFRATYNPLARLDPDSLTIKEDIDVIADGIVMRHDPSAAHWDDGGQVIISGVIAFLLLAAPKESRNLIELRAIIRNREALQTALAEMENLDGCGGLCQAAASAAAAKEGTYFLSNADANTRWLDSQTMESVLSESSFELSDLKNDLASVYLVLPVDMLSQHGRFLRLFVRCAMREMAKKTADGELKKNKCLFFLDEFFSLGKIDEIAKGVGTMRAYGLQLWPVMQDYGQLVDLYGENVAQTFFSNADVHQYFGNTDPNTLKHISDRFGVTTMADMPSYVPLEQEPITHTGIFSNHELQQKELQWRAQDRRQHENDYNTMISRGLGKSRLPPEAVAKRVAPRTDQVAFGTIVFTPGETPLGLGLLPYFEMDARYVWDAKFNADGTIQTATPPPPPQETTVSASSPPASQEPFDLADVPLWVWIVGGAVVSGIYRLLT